MNPVSWTESWQAIGSMAGALVSMLAFIALYIQIRQINTTVKSQNHSNIYHVGLQVNNMLIQNSNLIPYINGEKPLKEGTEDYHKCKLLCEVVLDFYEYIYLERNRMDKDIYQYWQAHMRITISQRPLYQWFLVQLKNSYDEAFIQMVTDNNSSK